MGRRGVNHFYVVSVAGRNYEGCSALGLLVLLVVVTDLVVGLGDFVSGSGPASLSSGLFVFGYFNLLDLGSVLRREVLHLYCERGVLEDGVGALLLVPLQDV